MSKHTSLIDQALARARGQALRGGLSKTAAAPADNTVAGLVKEANDVASAMEFVALDQANDGTVKAAHQVDMIRRFLKTGAGQPAMLPTEGGGTQNVAPASGKTTLLPEGGGNGGQPQEHEAAAGGLSRSAMEQPAPATAPTHTAPASGAGASKKASLFDMMTARFDQPVGGQPKTAAHGGPIDLEAEDGKLPPKRKNENSNIGLLESNTAPVSATRRQAKAPTRARLKKLFAGASDTTGDQTAKAIFPQAYGKGGLKVASSGGQTKEGSARDWSGVFLAAKDGSLGEEAQAFANYIEQM